MPSRLCGNFNLQCTKERLYFNFRSPGVIVLLRYSTSGSFSSGPSTKGEIHLHQNIFTMKKHLVFSALITLAAIISVEAQSLTYSGAQSPTDAVQKIRQVAEEQFGVFNSRDYDNDRDKCNCDKCQKHKKSKKHDDCNQKGKHYGKHKNQQGKHACSCERHSCQSEKKRDCDDDDNRCDNRNSRNGRDDDDRRYTSTRRDRDDEHRTQPQPTQRKPTSTAKVKTRPTPTAKPTSTRPGAKKTVVNRPVKING